jgi:5-methylcytosine-specific restriction endonuclease McrA
MGKHAGRHGRRWYRLRAQVKARREPTCCRCSQPIDYSLTYPDPDSFSVDHFPFPLSTHPHLAEDPANLRAAHLSCNQSAGAGAWVPDLGQPSEQW